MWSKYDTSCTIIIKTIIKIIQRTLITFAAAAGFSSVLNFTEKNGITQIEKSLSDYFKNPVTKASEKSGSTEKVKTEAPQVTP